MSVKLVNRRRGPGRESRADVDLDGQVVGYVLRQQSGKMLGYRAADYRATGDTLAEVVEELRACLG